MFLLCFMCDVCFGAEQDISATNGTLLVLHIWAYCWWWQEYIHLTTRSVKVTKHIKNIDVLKYSSVVHMIRWFLWSGFYGSPAQISFVLGFLNFFSQPQNNSQIMNLFMFFLIFDGCCHVKYWSGKLPDITMTVGYVTYISKCGIA